VLSQDPKWSQLRFRPLLVQHNDLQHHIKPLLARPIKACTAPCCTWILRCLYTQVDAHKARACLYYQLESPWCSLRIWLAEGSWVPNYSKGSQHWWPSTSLMTWRPYHDTVGTWIARSLSATGSSGTSATGLMTPFQTLSVSGGGGISIQGTGSAPIQCARGSRGDNNPGYPVFLRGDPHCFVCFLKGRASISITEGRRLRISFLRASTRPSRSPYCSGATLRVRLCDALFCSRCLDLLEARFHHVSARPPFGQHL
jgi:hypothetical protein